MSCPFAHDDAAYVLGALSPVERLDFERHLGGCDDCTRAVRELAGLPGLLRRVEASVVEHPPVDEPVPDTLLPSLSREVRRARRRRTRAAAGLAAAVAAVIVSVVVSQVGDGDASTPDVPGASSSPSGVVAETMDPVGDVPVRGSVTLEQVTWGTRLGLTCTYDPDSVGYQLPPTVGYTLFVRTRDGRTEQVGSWRSVGGMTMQLSAATAASREDIASVEVRAPDGRVVLRLAA
ncbi:MAG TPA: zf-HC2 domain-containing protein [Nocardioidaceae bacterium]|nr:zf-HC2 domain-containing protein [Nocardioidaceae bacterium]